MFGEERIIIHNLESKVTRSLKHLVSFLSIKNREDCCKSLEIIENNQTFEASSHQQGFKWQNVEDAFLTRE